MRLAIVAVVLLPMLAPAASATPCNQSIDPCTVIEVATPDGVYYVDYRGAVLGAGVWLYEESNGIYASGGTANENLQRGGCSSLFPAQCEIYPDYEHDVPDTLIYG